MRAVLIRLGQEILKGNKNLSKWISTQKDKYQGLPCEMKSILSANLTEGYRNKCEFTIGKSMNILRSTCLTLF